MTFSLLVGSEAFWLRAEQDIRKASSRLLVQVMAFEADRAGREASRAILDCRAGDRRVLVDGFTRCVIGGRWVRSPALLTDPAFRAEVRATDEMFRHMAAAGVGVRMTNPVGPLLTTIAFRNHKKLIVADDVAYIGGLNFTDRNFEWWDLMLRIDHPAIARRLAEDFDATYAGRPAPWIGEFGPARLYSLDGRSNRTGFQDIIRRIAAAERSICVVSPYLTFPFVGALKAAAARGVAVQLITPLPNNKPSTRAYVLHQARRAGFDVKLTPHMIHAKGMLIDGRTLALGSSNFDFISYHVEEELLALIEDAELAGAFEREVIAPAVASALEPDAVPASALAGWRSAALLRLVEGLILLRGQPPRASRDWARASDRPASAPERAPQQDPQPQRV